MVFSFISPGYRNFFFGVLHICVLGYHVEVPIPYFQVHILVSKLNTKLISITTIKKSCNENYYYRFMNVVLGIIELMVPISLTNWIVESILSTSSKCFNFSLSFTLIDGSTISLGKSSCAIKFKLQIQK